MSPWDEAEAKDDAKTAQKLLERGLKKASEVLMWPRIIGTSRTRGGLTPQQAGPKDPFSSGSELHGHHTFRQVVD